MCAASRPASLCLCAPLLVLLLPVLRRLFSVLRQCYFADCAACALHGLSPTGRACVWRGETRVSVAPTIRGPAPGPPTFLHIISDIGVARGLVPKFGEVCCMHHDACCPRSSGSPGDRHACLLFAAGRFVRAKRSVRRYIERTRQTGNAARQRSTSQTRYLDPHLWRIVRLRSRRMQHPNFRLSQSVSNVNSCAS